MPRTKGSKNKPKVANDYATQIAEKQETIASLNTEIASIQKAIEEQKNTLKEKKTALKKAEKEAASGLDGGFGNRLVALQELFHGLSFLPCAIFPR